MGRAIDEAIHQFDPARFAADRLLAAGFGSARILG
jgi:hypothetical protein